MSYPSLPRLYSAAVLLSLAAALPAEGFRPARPGFAFEFPRDHGSHPEFKTEWWYFTGNVEAENGDPFGYQLTFFRNRLEPLGGLETASPLAASELFVGHAGISDGRGKRHGSAERVGRAGLGQASASTETLDVRMSDWKCVLLEDGSIAVAASGEFGALDLRLTPEKPPVIHGEDGVHQKAADPRQASHYVSFTRLRTEGTLTWQGAERRVAGTSWMDHEFFSELLDGGDTGWDWFALQLDDDTELMVYRLKRRDGSYNPNATGTLVLADRSTVPLAKGGYTIEPTGSWTSPHTGATYPMGWRIEVPERGIDLAVEALFEDQEMLKQRTTGTAYWEGAVRVTGTSGGRAVAGVGYVEMVGYASPFTLLGPTVAAD
ncbi:MAG: lipocalin-like domain-containing protein [Candidatus Sumerlaeia bacterium]|nr:lipocalin-like domain-containing protein [Candidatus Sumerlaeia bacterium]